MSIYEEQLSRWAKAPSETEEGKCQVVVERVTNAINAEFGNKVRIFLQGSYKNRTNVRLDSDVDIVVCYQDVYFHSDAFISDEEKKTFQTLRTPSDYHFSVFRSKIESILINEFSSNELEIKEKCIKIKGNTYRVNADVVPAFVHRRLRTGYPNDSHTEGIEFRTSTDNIVISFPEQHYDNGVQKNKDTSQMYKPIVRILKNIRNELIDNGQITLKEMPSFVIECLVWNVLPHTHFLHNTYRDATKAVITQIWNDMRDKEKADKYAEVSDLHWLFHSDNNITPQQAESFMLKAWNVIG
ncbi:MAG: nucleotidyltransferase [Candidatus Paceibacterota bacterium]